MAHIHSLIDFVVTVLIVYKNEVLLVHHKELNKWLPVGGHIELHEDPEEALFREIKEETGLTQVKVLGKKPFFKSKGTKFLYSPIFLDIHEISKNHKHIGLTYFAETKSNKVKLAKKEHKNIHWFTKKELDDSKYNLSPAVRFYAKKAFCCKQKI